MNTFLITTLAALCVFFSLTTLFFIALTGRMAFKLSKMQSEFVKMHGGIQIMASGMTEANNLLFAAGKVNKDVVKVLRKLYSMERPAKDDPGFKNLLDTTVAQLEQVSEQALETQKRVRTISERWDEIRDGEVS